MTKDSSELHLFIPEPSEDFEEDLPPDPVSPAQARSSLHGKEFDAEAEEFLIQAGGRVLERNLKVLGFPMDFLVEGTNGSRYYVDGHGTPDQTDRPQAGMRRTDTMLKFGFKTICLVAERCPHPIILLTSHMPKDGSESAFYLSKLSEALWDAIPTVGDRQAFHRLHAYLTSQPSPTRPIEAAWRLGIQQGFSFVFDPEGDLDDA